MTDKIFTISQLATGTPNPVNLKTVFTFLKHEMPGARRSEEDKHQILFRREASGASTEDIVWKYKNEENRNCEYDALVAIYGVKLEK